MNRRDFCTIVALTSSALKTSTASAADSALPNRGGGFPKEKYTPYGYLDNPWHSWDMHRSGILRSLPGIGFSMYYPAGPGGYFSYAQNGVYEAQLALEFEIDAQLFRTPEDFARGQLSASHHSKNLLTYDLDVAGLNVASTFVQVNEDAIGVLVEFTETVGRSRTVRVLARHTYQLGGESWWGRDGLAGGFDGRNEALWTRSFAAGAVFAVTGDQSSAAQFVTASGADTLAWMQGPSQFAAKTSYYPEPLHGGLRYELQIGANESSSVIIIMARGENKETAIEHARASVTATRQEIARKHAEDAVFWNAAPQLAGDWPVHWKRGWVYDFETLRMMVRRPIGVYKHPWDAMQIQAPRNVLAETSIDMWALSYGDLEAAKAVFLGQFADALADNIPCMREDGIMNMVAADGSECGTSISWCFPFFCAESIFNRAWDLAWLRALYPHLAALLRWTLAHRIDSGGFLVGKCSWETGMDASKRFLIQQPTGGEITEFIRLVELQAAAAHAGRVLARFARLLGEDASIQEWERVHDRYTERTQELWKDGWFRDFDTRTMHLVTGVPPDPAQSAPAFCGVATPEQKQQMRLTLQKVYGDSRALGENPAQGWDDGLAWSSMVLPFVESAWATNDRALAAQVVGAIADRIYASMDRRVLMPPEKPHDAPHLGWPGVSCEIWGAHGAFGGEGYGWGAVMPAHIIRSIFGMRETDDPEQLGICPNLPASFMIANAEYAIRGLHHGPSGDRLDLKYRVLNGANLMITGEWFGRSKVVGVSGSDQKAHPIDQDGREWRFHALNGEQYLVRLDLGHRFQ